MPDKTSLGTRMKENYENRAKQYLTRRTPVIIRIDGKAFHTYTKGLKKPFDEGLIEDMQETTKFLCENIQGCKMGYTQSDEISLVVTDYDKLETSAWFDYNVQKMTSIAASLATAKFNQLRLYRDTLGKVTTIFKPRARQVVVENMTSSTTIGCTTLAFFDARVFNIPKEEVLNYLIWRQRDAEKNSISMLAQSLYSQKELHQKHSDNMQEMCFQKGFNWNDLDFSKKRGSFIVKNTYVDGYCLSARDAKGNKVVEQFQDLGYAIFDEKVVDWVSLPEQVVRTKWEVIETPIFSKDSSKVASLIKD